MIELKNISKYYNNNGVVTLGLRNINLNFDKNEIVAIVGESGSGKSTLLNVICGVDSYEEGEILFNGYETSYFNREDMDTFRKQNVSFIYQNYNIIDSYTVLENVMFPLLINGYNRKEAKERALELIKKVGLEHRIKNRGTKLSGGEKQRCVIARALATDAPILACDEPTGNLDSKTGKEIIELIKEVAKDKLVLIVTHNYEQVENIVTRTIRMADGEVVSDSNVNNNVTTELKDGDVFAEDNKKIKYKTIAQIGLNNLKSTPKKNIFVFLVLLVLSIIGLVLFANCFESAKLSQYNAYEGYNNTLRERIIIYEKDHKSFDPKLFDGYEYYINSFYEDEGVNISLEANGTVYFNATCYMTTHMPYNITKNVGSKDISNGGVYLVLPDSYYLDTYEERAIIDGSIRLSSYVNCYIDIVGIGRSNEIMMPLLICKKDLLLDSGAYLYEYNFAKIDCEDGTREIKVTYDSSVTKPTIELYQANVNVKNFSLMPMLKKYEMYDFSYDVNMLEVKKAEHDSVKLPTDFLENTCYELTIYANDFKKIEKIAQNNNLSYIIPSKSGTNLTSFSFISFIFAIIYSSLIMIFLVFISYAVLSKVYQSRRRDYAIMRSLGMMRPQMAKIMRFEVVTIGFVASILASIIFIIIGFATNVAASVIFATFTPWFVILYFLFMFLFDLRLANRFNKKLFKFSITKTIKEVF